ncbi:AEC family transporter [Eubacterium sp. F2]|jgi:predicted permease|uniref:AEC family transporter n=1 Tax=Eubacterium sp. F2 TaxID=3381348 RepID=UPI003907F97E
MLNNFIICLDTTIPAFLMMALGIFLRKIGFMTPDFTKKLNNFVFKVTLPVLLFYSLASKNFYEAWDGRFVLYCFLATCASIGLVILLSYLLCRTKRNVQGEFIQSAYRSSAAILGVMLAQNMYGSAGKIPLMILGAVPLYNIMAVLILSFYKPDREPLSGKLIKSTLLNVLKNPLLIGIFLGLFWSLLSIPMPKILATSLDTLGNTASPLGLLALGASFSLGKSLSQIKLTSIAAFFKLAGLGILFLPLAVRLGFRGEELLAAIIMCGSPTTVTSFVMAKGFGHDGSLTSGAVILTTLLSSVSLTAWMFLFKSLGYL